MRTLDEHWRPFEALIPDPVTSAQVTMLRLAWYHGANATLRLVYELSINRHLSPEATSALLMGLAEEIGEQIGGAQHSARRAD